jgi:hypothetical protein
MVSIIENESIKDAHSRKHPWDFVHDILLAAAILTIPLLILTAALLFLVFSYLIKPATFNSLGFPINQNAHISSDAYYINFSATSLTTVASWCSSLAPLLPPTVMTLLLYHISAMLKTKSENHANQELPTPFQLSLLVSFSEASLLSLWRWFVYISERKREKSVSIIRLATTILTISIVLR